MITIIIFSSNRLEFLSQLIRDIKKCNATIKNQIILVSYNENKSNINKIKKITRDDYFTYYIEKKNLTISEKLKKYSKKVKTKFLWHMGDDDRIKFNTIKELNSILKKNKNISGVTINYDSKKNIKKSIYKNSKTECKLENFNVNKNIYRMGMSSSQIFKTKEFTKFKQPNKNYFNNAYYPVGIITSLIFTKKNWKYIDKKMTIYRYGIINYDKKLDYLERLDDEFKGYLKPIKKHIKNNYSLIFRNIFFKNIMSWIFLNIRLNGKNKTYKVILKNLKFFPLNFILIFILLSIFILPVNFLHLLKKKLT